MQIVVYTKTPSEIPSSTLCDWQISLSKDFPEENTVTLTNQTSINVNGFTVLIYPIMPAVNSNIGSITYYIRYKYNFSNNLYNNWSQPVTSTVNVSTNVGNVYNNFQGFEFHTVEQNNIGSNTAEIAKSIRQSIPSGVWNINISDFTSNNDIKFYSGINILYPSNKVWIGSNTLTGNYQLNNLWQYLYNNQVKVAVQSRGQMGLTNEVNIIEIDLLEGIPFKILLVNSSEVVNSLYYVPSLPCYLTFETNTGVTINSVALGAIGAPQGALTIPFIQSNNIWYYDVDTYGVPGFYSPYYIVVNYTQNNQTYNEYFCLIMSSLITSPSLLGINC